MDEYKGQTYLPIARTVGELKKQLSFLPDEMPFGFCNQEHQQIAIREYSDGSKYALFNGVSGRGHDEENM